MNDVPVDNKVKYEVLKSESSDTKQDFLILCRKCHLDIETGQGWRCETCPEYDLCNSCYNKDGGISHPHKLTNHPSTAERDAQNQEAVRVLQHRILLDVVVHASRCRFRLCEYPDCRKVKELFTHGCECKVRACGGCARCKKMWFLLQLHARECEETICRVPRCRDLKEHITRMQQQSDSRPQCSCYGNDETTDSVPPRLPAAPDDQSSCDNS